MVIATAGIPATVLVAASGHDGAAAGATVIGSITLAALARAHTFLTRNPPACLPRKERK